MILKNSSGLILKGTKILKGLPLLHADTIAYDAAYSAAGGTLSEIELYAINDFVLGLDSSGIRTKLIRFYPLIGLSSALQSIPLYGTTMTFFGGTNTYTTKGFSTNGVTSTYGSMVLDAYIGATAPWAGCQVYISVDRNNSSNQMPIVQVIAIGKGFGIFTYSTAIFNNYYSDNNHSVTSGSSHKGNYIMTRISDAQKVTKDLRSGKVTRPDVVGTATVSGGFPQDLRIGGGPGGLSPCYHTIGCASYFSSVVESDVDIYDSLICTLMAKLGRAV